MKHWTRERDGGMYGYGKPEPSFMRRVVFASLGARNRRIIRGPGRGLDNAVLALGKTGVMLITTDPMSMIPGVGIERSAWLSVHLIASDYTTSGLRPEFSAFSFNFPREMHTNDRARYLKCVGIECRKLGVSIVAGHTGSYPGAGYTVVGGGTMFGFCSKGEYVDPSMARPGDTVLMTKGAAIEASAMLALSFPRHTTKKVGNAVWSRAKALILLCSTVADAFCASAIGLGREGVTSMHDATEGGVLGGLSEMASASGHRMLIDKKMIHVPSECEAVCAAFGIDPLSSLSEGTLLITCKPARTDELVKKMRRSGIAAYSIGRVADGRGLWASEHGGPGKKTNPRKDGYWRAYAEAVHAGLD